jgi:hypothetical protein
MLHQLTIYLRRLPSPTDWISHAKQYGQHEVPTEDSEKALYAWGPPEDASDVQYRHSDAGCIRTCRD